MLMASTYSFFFSHRIWFFFQSTIYIDDVEGNRLHQLYALFTYSRSQVVLKGLKDACIESKERLYLANSTTILE